MKRLRVSWTFCALFVLAAGCATVPKGAPDELHAADAAIRQAQDDGADVVVPKSMKIAEAKLADAVKLYDAVEPSRRAEARTEANDARSIAERARALTADVRDWDGGDLMAYETRRRAEEDLVNARSQLEQARGLLANAPSPGAEDRQPLEIAQPLAFFDTAGTTLPDVAQPALNELVRALKDNPALHLTLVGHADKRGDSAKNDALAKERAIAVATYINDQGVEAQRISIASRGSKEAAAPETDLARLQLDRRVDAQLRAVAH